MVKRSNSTRNVSLTPVNASLGLLCYLPYRSKCSHWQLTSHAFFTFQAVTKSIGIQRLQISDDFPPCKHIIQTNTALSIGIRFKILHFQFGLSSSSGWCISLNPKNEEAASLLPRQSLASLTFVCLTGVCKPRYSSQRILIPQANNMCLYIAQAHGLLLHLPLSRTPFSTNKAIQSSAYTILVDFPHWLPWQPCSNLSASSSFFWR